MKGVMASVNILNFFKSGSTEQRIEEMILIESTNKVYLKRLALDICINHIARTISNSEFRIMKGRKTIRNTIDYKLNVRPNTDSSASDFWQKVIYKMIYDNEVLIIQTDTEDLVVADDFTRKEMALYDDTFQDVTVKDYTYDRVFQMSDVIYLEYQNERISQFVEGLYSDYGKLFGQMMDHSMRKNQLRGYFKYKDGGNLDKATFERQKKQVERLTKIFENNSVAYAPLTEGIELEDLTPTSAQKDESIPNLIKIKRDLTDEVAKMLGIPSNLVHGDVAELDKSIEAYITFCIDPLIKKLTDELNAKLFEPSEYMAGNRIKVIGIHTKNALKNAINADKLVASGLYTRNQVREKFGDEIVDDPEMDRYLITKNYEHTDERSSESDASKGGENE